MVPDDSVTENSKLTANAWRQFIRDVREGVSDDELKKKHNLDGRTLMIKKMAARDLIMRQRSAKSRSTVKVNAAEVIKDIEAGASDEALMARYNLTNRQLQKVYRKLISSQMMTARQLAGRLSVTESQIFEAFVEAAQATGDDEEGQG
jgi:hypothetical protein